MNFDDYQNKGVPLRDLLNGKYFVRARQAEIKEREARKLLVSLGYKIPAPSAKKRGRPKKPITIASMFLIGKKGPRGRPKINDEHDELLICCVEHIKSTSSKEKISDKAALTEILKSNARETGKSEHRALSRLPSLQTMLSRARKKLQISKNK